MKKVKRLGQILRAEGFAGLVRRVVLRISPPRSEPRRLFDLPVRSEDALRADWSSNPPRRGEKVTVESGPVTIAWIMSPPSSGSGGHQNLFRFIDYAEKAGHRCIIYFYVNSSMFVNSAHMKEMLRESGAFPDVAAEMFMYDSAKGVDPDVQAIFATSWETAYPAFLDESPAKRFYFVQDFEPSFYPQGSHSLLAENTYRFGFHGITAGAWLSYKLKTEFGMETDHFDFAVNSDIYSVSNFDARNEVFFYARPSTPRRGFELGLLALEELARARPGVTISLAGEHLKPSHVPFEHKSLTLVTLSELNVVYNRCVAGLVISASNMSLLPLELMASGAVPVVNDAPNNRMVTDNPFIEYVPDTPAAIAQKLIDLVDREHSTQRLREMSASLDGKTWDHSGRQFLDAFEGAMRG